MASGFPNSIDNFTDPLTTSPLNSPSHAGQHQDLNDAVNKIETYMGLVKVASLTFTSTSSAQQINNCITSLYNAYRVVFFGVGDQTSCCRLNLRFVDGTTPDTAGNSYWIEVNSNNASGPTRTWASTNSRIPVGFIGNESAFCSFEFSGGTSTTAYKPGTATYIANGTADFVGGTMHFLKRTTTAYEGIQMYPDTGNWAGTIQVYGYRN